MTAWNCQQGLQETGAGVYARLPPDGGWSSAGRIVDGDESLLAHTLCREYAGSDSPPDPTALFTLMAELRRSRRK